MAKEKGSRLIANNKKAYHDYFIEETYEAGIALHGTEVKSLRMGKCSIKESYLWNAYKSLRKRKYFQPGSFTCKKTAAS